MTCPRCAGLCFHDLCGDWFCINCGAVIYRSPPLPYDPHDDQFHPQTAEVRQQRRKS